MILLQEPTHVSEEIIKAIQKTNGGAKADQPSFRTASVGDPTITFPNGQSVLITKDTKEVIYDDGRTIIRISPRTTVVVTKPNGDLPGRQRLEG